MIDGYTIHGVIVDEVSGWRTGEELVDRVSHHAVGRALDLNPRALTWTRAFDAVADAALLEHVGPAPAARAVTVHDVVPVQVRRPGWPRPVRRRRHDETRAAHTGRRRVATALRRRARRRGVPAPVTVLQPRTRHFPHTTISVR